MRFYEDFREFVDDHETEIFSYAIKCGKDEDREVEFGMIQKVVPLPNGDILIGFNIHTANDYNKQSHPFEDSDIHYHKLSEIHVSCNPELEDVVVEE